MFENDFCMVNNRMILFAKRFRSKAPSAASLSPGQFGDQLRTDFDFLLTLYCDTVSKGGEGGLLIFIVQGRPNGRDLHYTDKSGMCDGTIFLDFSTTSS